MKILSLKTTLQSQIISQAVKVLQSGGLIIYPTETVYGAGVDAANPQAVAKLSQFKSRPLGKPYSVAVSDQKMAEKYVELNSAAKKLYRTFLPGPLTVISKVATQGLTFAAQRLDLKGADIAPGVASELGTLGIRIPDYSLIIEIVKRLNRPITATSANQAYQKRPYQIPDIINQISDKKKKLIDLIIDAGELPHREPSTVIDTTLDDPVTLRVGEIKISNEDKILSRSPENTQNLAKELWQKYQHFSGQRTIVFALEGPLGAGKTEFTKGLARAMGLTQSVTSPTFQIVNIYESPTISAKGRSASGGNNQQLTINNLTHIDAWRLESSTELDALDFTPHQKATDSCPWMEVPGRRPSVRDSAPHRNQWEAADSCRRSFTQKITDKSVIALEWADRVADAIRARSEDAVIIWVKIKYGKTINERLINWGTL